MKQVVQLTAALVILGIVGAACAASGSEFSLITSETPDNDAIVFAVAGEDITGEAISMRVKVDEEVTINLENKHGQFSPTSGSHDFAIVPELDDIATLAATGAINDHVLWDSAIDKLFPEESSSVTFVPDAPGSYYFICTIPGHAASGMMGEFVVEG